MLHSSPWLTHSRCHQMITPQWPKGPWGSPMEPTWSGCSPLLCVALPKGEDRVSPKANKLAYCPGLTNTGWLSCRSAAGTATDDEEKDDEEVAPHEGGGGLRATGGAPYERLADSAREMPEKTCGKDDSTTLTSCGGGGGGLCPRAPWRGGVILSPPPSPLQARRATRRHRSYSPALEIGAASRRAWAALGGEVRCRIFGRAGGGGAPMTGARGPVMLKRLAPLLAIRAVP